MESGCSSFHFYMMRMAMKMAAVSTISLLLLCCSAISSTVSTDSQDTCDHYAAVGNNSFVPLNHALDNSERLRWMHNTQTVFLRKSSNQLLQGTEDDIYANGSLKLTNVNKANAGLYTPEVYSKDGKAVTGVKSVNLCVLDPAPKPEVTTECPSSNVKFTCKFATAVDLKIQWLQNNKDLAKEKAVTLIRSAQQVEKDSFVCKVSNHVSSMTSAPVTQACYKPKPVIPDKIFGINTWIIVGTGGGVVLVLIIVVIVCCICTRRKKRDQMKDEGELRLVWTNEQQRQPHQHNHPPDQHHHHHHHQQQQPAGHTGPRQHRSKQHREQQRPRAPDLPSSHPQPSPRRPAQAPRPVNKVDDEQPPPLPQPRKKTPKTPRV